MFGDSNRDVEGFRSQDLREPPSADRAATLHPPAANPISGDPVALNDELWQIAEAQSDPQAFAPIYERYVDLVYRYALGRLRDPERAADLTSTVFSRAIAALPSFSPKRRATGSTFRSWLMTIARNAVIDSVRRQPLTADLDEPAIHHQLRDLRPTPEEHAIQEDERLRIERALAQLSATQRQIVELRGIGMKGAEIADILGMTVGAVKTSHFRAYSRLRTLLHEEELT